MKKGKVTKGSPSITPRKTHNLGPNSELHLRRWTQNLQVQIHHTPTCKFDYGAYLLT